MLTKQSIQGGFTLIELLVVVSIIGILSSIVLASLVSAKQQSRNATRLSSIHTLVNAFSLSLTNGPLPVTTGYVCVSATCYGLWSSYVANAAVDAYLAPSLSKKPSDPVGGTRARGGFLYKNPATVNSVTGAYLDYLIEPPGSCGAGTAVSTTADYVDCYLKLD